MNVFSKIAWKTLTKNRTRTLVTIIGIALSAAMFTAVTTALSSYMSYYRGYMEYNYGSWNASYYDLSAEELAEMESDSNMKTVTALEQIGFALLEDSVNEYKPYLYVCAMDENASELLPIHLTGGRMPESASEILIPDHLSSNGGVNYAIGDVITLELGERTYNGSVLNNHSSYNEEGESVENCTTYTYTVVGTYSRPSIEDYYAPGYTALTVSENSEATDSIAADMANALGTTDSIVTESASSSSAAIYDVYYQLKDEYEATTYQPTYLTGEHTWTANAHYLEAWGLTESSTEYTLLYTFGGILIAIILFGSVALIYNSFSISVSERMHMFAMLSSVGATRRQLIRMVLTEGLFLGCVGIPAGILAGITGMGITFACVGDELGSLLYDVYPETFSLSVSAAAILIAAVIALVTILISAYLPVHKALRHSAMETIRGSREIVIKRREHKTSRLTWRLFGFEGTIAARNYKRSKKKYRATVGSIFVSIVLFVTTSGYCAYMQEAVDQSYQNIGYDLMVTAYVSDDSGMEGVQELSERISGLTGVTEAHYSSILTTTIMVDKELLDDSFTDYFSCWNSIEVIPEQAFVKASVIFVEDAYFDAYAQAEGLDAADYYNAGDAAGLRVLLYDRLEYYGEDDHTRYANVFDGREQESFLFCSTKEQEGLWYMGCWVADGIYQWIYEDEETYETIYFPAAENSDTISVTADLVEEMPDMLLAEAYTEYSVKCLMPMSMLDTVCALFGADYANTTLPYTYATIADNAAEEVTDDLSEIAGTEEGGDAVDSGSERKLQENLEVTYAISTDTHATTADELSELENTIDGITLTDLTDYAEELQAERAFLLILRVFCYGFIILISLIAVANVFNTISTNIQLRGRELAMLQSVGMTRRGMQRMMSYECLLYGSRGLISGIVVSVLLLYGIYLLADVDTAFFVPWYSLVIAIAGVFVVVFSTMLYAVRRLQKENTIDVLKNENV